MDREDAEEEFAKIEAIRSELQAIPNYANYFLVDGVEIGKPEPLTAEDLAKFNDVCSGLSKDQRHPVTAETVNGKLEQFRVLDLPDGGVEVDDWLRAQGDRPDAFKELNKALVDLLRNGIAPMNASGIYHTDVKPSNILIKRDSSGVLRARLIDWGMQINTRAGDKKHYSQLKNRGLQYNSPPSVAFLTSKFNHDYDKLLLNSPDGVSWDDLFAFSHKYMNEWATKEMSISRFHHYELYKIVFASLFAPGPSEEEIKHHFLNAYMYRYLTDVLASVTDADEDGTPHADMARYIDEQLLKVMDIWGFSTCYLGILGVFGSSSPRFFAQMRHLYFKCTFGSPTSVPDIEALCTGFSRLDDVVVVSATPSLGVPMDISAPLPDAPQPAVAAVVQSAKGSHVSMVLASDSAVPQPPAAEVPKPPQKDESESDSDSDDDGDNEGVAELIGTLVNGVQGSNPLKTLTAVMGVAQKDNERRSRRVARGKPPRRTRRKSA